MTAMLPEILHACWPARSGGTGEAGRSGPALKATVQYSCVPLALEACQAVRGESQSQVCKHGVGTVPAAPTHHSALLQDGEQRLALHSEALLHPLKAGRLDFAVAAGAAPVCLASCRLQLSILTSGAAQEWRCMQTPSVSICFWQQCSRTRAHALQLECKTATDNLPCHFSFRLTSMMAAPPVRIDALQDVQADWLQACQHPSHVIHIVHLIHSILCSELLQALQERRIPTGRYIGAAAQGSRVCLGPNIDAQACAAISKQGD